MRAVFNCSWVITTTPQSQAPITWLYLIGLSPVFPIVPVSQRTEVISSCTFTTMSLWYQPTLPSKLAKQMVHVTITVEFIDNIQRLLDSYHKQFAQVKQQRQKIWCATNISNNVRETTLNYCDIRRGKHTNHIVLWTRSKNAKYCIAQPGKPNSSHLVASLQKRHGSNVSLFLHDKHTGHILWYPDDAAKLRTY